MEELKNKLLDINLVEDNEYLDKYCELIENNRDKKEEKFKTQKHHIIPRYYFKRNNLKIDNSKENLINLTHEDHFWAHYYLTLCSTSKYKYSSEYAILKALNCKIDKITWVELCSKAKEINILKEDFKKRDSENKKGKPNLKLRGQLVDRKYSKETLGKMSQAWHNKSEEEKQRLSKLHSELAKGRKVSEETRQKLREIKLGTTYNKNIPLYCYNIKEKVLLSIFDNYEEAALFLGTSKGVITETVFEKTNYKKIYFLSKIPLSDEELNIKYNNFINKERKIIDKDYPLYCYNLDTGENLIFKNLKTASETLNFSKGCISVCFGKEGPVRTYRGWIFARRAFKEEEINYFKSKRRIRVN